MIGQPRAASGEDSDNSRGTRVILALALGATALYLVLALAGDLRDRLGLFFPSYALLFVVMLLAWRVVRADLGLMRLAVVAALAFRLVASLGAPTLSDDVYRYVWDGKVQLAGVHPYRYAPRAPELSGLRDDAWESVNHPQVQTIYPPLSQLLFLCMTAFGAGPFGFKLLLGLTDFGVVLALDHLLRRASLPRDRLILYAWNPLAVLESSGSGHIEPVGVLLTVLAGAWIIDRRPQLSTTALAASVQIKLLSAALIPAFLVRGGRRAAVALVLVLVALALPYAATGPAVGGGLAAYAERWEHNATVYAVTESALERIEIGTRIKTALGWFRARVEASWIPWTVLYEHVWPRDIARLLVGAVAGIWVLAVSLRRDLPVPRQTLFVLGGVLLLSPTLHPWYLLWLLPWAAALASPGWLLLSGTIVLAYGNPGGDLTIVLKAIEFLPPLALALVSGRSRTARAV